MQKENLKFRLDYSPKVFVVWERDTEVVTYFNEKAKELYGLTDQLEELFTTYVSRFLQTFPDLVKKLENSQEKTHFYQEISTQTADGQEQMGDLLIGFWNNEKTQIYLEFMPKLDQREIFLKNLVDQACKPMFLGDLDDELDVSYGNELFFKTFGKNKMEFASCFKNKFMNTMIGIEKETFVNEIRETLSNHAEFHKDIQITTADGEKLWFYLELEYRPLGKNKGAIKGMMAPYCGSCGGGAATSPHESLSRGNSGADTWCALLCGCET